MKTLRLRGLVLVMAALLPAAAFASPTVNTLGGDTRVQLSADLVGALTSLGVSVKASYPARLRGASASFPIPGGELDLGTLKGEVDHAGGLTLRAGATEVNLSSYTIDTTGAGDSFSGALVAMLSKAPTPAFIDAVRHANRVAAMSTEKPGAALAIPHFNEVVTRFDAPD